MQHVQCFVDNIINVNDKKTIGVSNIKDYKLFSHKQIMWSWKQHLYCKQSTLETMLFHQYVY